MGRSCGELAAAHILAMGPQVAHFASAGVIEASLTLAGKRGGDLTPQVYARLFAAQPDLEALFSSAANVAVKS